MNIVFISGPAHHGDDIFSSLKKEHQVTYFKNYPTFLKQERDQFNGNRLFNLVSYFVWGVFNKLNIYYLFLYQSANQYWK